jgi:predicted NBD/HSP70 family sugar kinase
MYLGIDIGGTKTLIALFSDSGELQQKVRFETPPHYPDFITSLRSELQQLNLRDLDYVVVGAPGRIDREHGVGLRFGNLDWHNVPFLTDIQTMVKAPISIENDANLAGLYEANVVLNDYKNAVYLTISTGIGGANIRNGVLDSYTLDSEPGQIMLEHAGTLQKWEAFSSGRAIFQKYGQAASDIDDPEIWQEIVKNLVSGLTIVVTLMTPTVVILGGGVGGHFEKFGELLKSELPKNISDLVAVPEIIPASRPDDCVIYGCYTLARQKHAQS